MSEGKNPLGLWGLLMDSLGLSQQFDAMNNQTHDHNFDRADLYQQLSTFAQAAAVGNGLADAALALVDSTANGTVK